MGGPLALCYQGGYLHYRLEGDDAVLRWHRFWVGAVLEFWIDGGLALYGGDGVVAVEGQSSRKGGRFVSFDGAGSAPHGGVRFDYGSDGYVELELRGGQGREVVLRFGRVMAP